MNRVRVIAPLGANLRGPATVRLSDEQAKRRGAFLAPFAAKAKGVFDVPGDITLNFKHGEEFDLADGEGRLNSQLFEIIGGKNVKAKAKADTSDAGVSAENGEDDTGEDTE